MALMCLAAFAQLCGVGIPSVTLKLGLFSGEFREKWGSGQGAMPQRRSWVWPVHEGKCKEALEFLFKEDVGQGEISRAPCWVPCGCTELQLHGAVWLASWLFLFCPLT